MKIRHSALIGSVFSCCKDTGADKIDGGIEHNPRRQSRSGSLGGLLDGSKMSAGATLVIGDPISQPKSGDAMLLSSQVADTEPMPSEDEVEVSGILASFSEI